MPLVWFRVCYPQAKYKGPWEIGLLNKQENLISGIGYGNYHRLDSSVVNSVVKIEIGNIIKIPRKYRP